MTTKRGERGERLRIWRDWRNGPLLLRIGIIAFWVRTLVYTTSTRSQSQDWKTTAYKSFNSFVWLVSHVENQNVQICFYDLCVYLASFKIHIVEMMDNNDLFWDLISWVTSVGTSFMLACALMTLSSQLKFQVRVEFSCADKIQSGLRFFHWWIPALLIFLGAVQCFNILLHLLNFSNNLKLLPQTEVSFLHPKLRLAKLLALIIPTTCKSTSTFVQP